MEVPINVSISGESDGMSARLAPISPLKKMGADDL